MRYPRLVRIAKTPIHVEFAQEGLNVYGEPLDPMVVETVCNFQDSAKTVLTAEKKLIQLSGTALISGDVATELKSLSGGTVTINGEERRIFQGARCRNPDGTVNYVRLDLV